MDADAAVESIAGRIYITRKYGRDRYRRIDSTDSQNQLCKDIFNVMHNKATEQTTCTETETLHSRTPFFRFQIGINERERAIAIKKESDCDADAYT